MEEAQPDSLSCLIQMRFWLPARQEKAPCARLPGVEAAVVELEAYFGMVDSGRTDRGHTHHRLVLAILVSAVPVAEELAARMAVKALLCSQVQEAVSVGLQELAAEEVLMEAQGLMTVEKEVEEALQVKSWRLRLILKVFVQQEGGLEASCQLVEVVLVSSSQYRAVSVRSWV